LLLLSLEDALTILNKWKDESVPVLVLGQNSFRQGLRTVQEGGVDWNTGLRGTVSQVSVCQGTISSKAGRVVFESPAGNLSLSIDSCVLSYDAASERPPFLKSDDRSKILSCLFIFFPTNEAFVVYELQER
jgi:hypothetical protein